MNALLSLNIDCNKNINEVEKQKNKYIDLYNILLDSAKKEDSLYMMKSIISFGIYHLLYRRKYDDELEITLGAINKLAEEINVYEKYIENLKSEIEKNKRIIDNYIKYIERSQLFLDYIKNKTEDIAVKKRVLMGDYNG